jgi:DNA-binding NarL/FixJ family response regulator
MFMADVRLELGGHAAKEAAQRDFDAALQYWLDAKATFYLHLMQERARLMGLAFPVDALPEDRRPKESDQLTKRQREIALLVADGMTNREIAERMSLSVRTAESHVEQIRTKLGFHTRAQIAAWVTERYGAARIN